MTILSKPMQKNEIDIEAGAGVFRYFKTLPLSFESAIGELVDNSIASWIKNKKILPENFQLEIDISIDRGNNIITVFDNAFGISEEDYHRAFVVGKVPEDATSLNEFGAGMKVSAFWFGDKWTVRTKPINDKYQKTVKFDLDKIEKHGTKVEFQKVKKPTKDHFTQITLYANNHFPSNSNIKNIKSHLSSMFRNWLKDEDVILTIDGQRVMWKDPNILFMQNAKDYQNPDWEDQDKQYWSEIIDFKFKDGSQRRIKGYVGLLESPSSKDAGFSLIRRGRVIQGGINSWKPDSNDSSNYNIFQHARSYQYVRLFGELNFSNFLVDNHKTKILWNSSDKDNAYQSKNAFLKYLYELLVRNSLTGESTEFWYQMENWLKAKKGGHEERIRREKSKNTTPIIDKASMRTTEVLESDHSYIEVPEVSELDTRDKEIKETKTYNPVEFPIINKDEEWKIIIQPVETELPNSDWFTFRYESDKDKWPQIITVKVNLSHQHSKNIFRLGEPGEIYSDVSTEVYRLLAYMAIAERKLKFSSEKKGEMPGTYRRFINKTINTIVKRKKN